MTARLASLQTRAQIALVCGLLLLVVLMGYFVAIAPKRSTAADLKKQTASVQKQIDGNRSSAFNQALPAIRAASVFSVAKAMPTQVEMPNVLLQLDKLAQDSGITFDKVQPGTSAVSSVPDTVDPFAAEPIQVQFTGSYYNLVAFLMRLRNLVRVENGHLNAVGRLFDVSDISFCTESGPSAPCASTLAGNQKQDSRFPVVQATLTVNAFVPQAPASVVPTTPGSTDTTATTTGATTTTSSPTSASPSTSGGTS
ncbi:MAG: type 4a pilus biogenesis protein PilO [Gaiellaceae bacterium]